MLYLSCLYSIHALTHIVIVSDSPNSGCKGEYQLYFEKIRRAESPHRSSLNTCPICKIIGAFERREHSQDNAHFKNAKIFFFGVGRTYR